MPSVDPSRLARTFFNRGNYIGIHVPVFDDFGFIVDAELFWYNASFRTMRPQSVAAPKSLLETYPEPHIALGYINEAWKNGQSYQFYGASDAARLELPKISASASILVNWERVDDFIVEVGENINEFLSMQDLLNNQFSLVAIANKRRFLAEERERIGRNLHDSVIQHLYVGSLILGTAVKAADPNTAQSISEVASLINRVIEEVRDEILDLSARRRSSLRKTIEDILIQMLTSAGSDFELEIECGILEDQIIDHLRAVISEASSNAVRHGGALKLYVKLLQINDNLELTIEDDGSGIDPSQPLQNGLNNMKARANSLGGDLFVKESTYGGVSLLWVVPNSKEQK